VLRRGLGVNATDQQHQGKQSHSGMLSTLRAEVNHDPA
jgi:hypothetical protein